jgi:hypothetical protein
MRGCANCACVRVCVCVCVCVCARAWAHTRTLSVVRVIKQTTSMMDNITYLVILVEGKVGGEVLSKEHASLVRPAPRDVLDGVSTTTQNHEWKVERLDVCDGLPMTPEWRHSK